MTYSILGRMLWQAVDDDDFRRRLLRDAGSALAEEGYIFSDAEMGQWRDYAEHLHGLNERAARERITAWARSYYRE